MALALLMLAIATEVGATAALPRTEGFTHLVWTPVVLLGYALSIWLLALVVREMPVSIAYAIWAGLGTALIAVVGVLLLGESWDLTTVAALSMIVVGVVVLNLHGAHCASNSAGSAQRAQARLHQRGVQPHGQHGHLVHQLRGPTLGTLLAAAPDG
jgi:multidrug transporter EmrE-like cation transporter